MQANQVTVRISYNNLRQPAGTIPLEKEQGVRSLKLDAILQIVNNYMQEKGMKEFMDIQIKCKNQWRNILEVFGNSERNYLQVDNTNNNYQIELMLVESEEDINYERLVRSWQERIGTLNKKIQVIEEELKKDAKKVEDQYGIDLAFFYAEPKIYLDPHKRVPLENPSREVSFLLQVKRIFDKLSKKNAIRSAKIQIQVATIPNLNKALDNGVKILHFSCHGKENIGLQIEGYDQNFGVVEFLSCSKLVEVLSKHKKVPQIIVFNACQSQKLAQQIHHAFADENIQNPKYITTIGYYGRIQNTVCEQFAQTFYSKIFKGEEVQGYLKSFKENKQVRIFYNDTEKIRLKPSKINELNRCIDIKSKLTTVKQNQYFPKVSLYELMRKLFERDKGKILQISGQSKIGKTLLIEKAINYLQQRDLVNKLIRIQLREPNHVISNILQFRVKLKDKLREADFYNGKKQDYYLIVIDHCQLLMKYQRKQFDAAIRELQGQLERTKFMARLIIITATRNTQNSSFTMEKYHIQLSYAEKIKRTMASMTWRRNEYIEYWSKTPQARAGISRTKIDYPKQQPHFFDICNSYIREEVSKLPVSFLAELPLINLFPQRISHKPKNFQMELNTNYNGSTNSKRKMSINKQQPQIESLRDKIFKQSEKKITEIELICEKILNDPKQSKQRTMATLLILKEMQYILAVHFLRFHQIIKFQQKQFWEIKQKEDLNTLLRVIHKFINVCLAIKVGNENISSTIKKLFEIFELKLYFTAYYTYSQNADKDPMPKQVAQNIIENIKKTSDQSDISSTTMQSALKFIEFSRTIAANVLGNKNKSCYKFFDQCIQDHLQSIEHLKNKISNNYLGSIDEQDQQNQEERQLIEQFQLRYHIFDRNSIYLLLLPLLPIIKSALSNKAEVSHEHNIHTLMGTIKEYAFIEQHENIYSNMFKYFYEDYIQCLFQLQKLRLSNKSQSQKIKRFDIINQLNKWIKICERQKLISLKNSINNYKNMSFNSLVALVSFPTDKIFRFEHDIMEMVGKACEMFRYSILPRRDCLDELVLEKYNENDLPIPIALFFADTIRKQKQKKKDRNQVFFILENYNGKSRKNYPIIEAKFFKCQLAIFCGEGVSQNIPFEKRNSKIGAYICIDTFLPNEKIMEQRSKKQKFGEEEDRIKQAFRQISKGLIIREMLINFYTELCKIFFSEHFENRGQQIIKSIQIAKDHAYISCLLKYGMYFSEQIETIYENIRYDLLHDTLYDQPPLCLSETNDIYHKEELWSGIQENEQHKKLSLIENLEEQAQVGYCKELHLVLSQILHYCTQRNKKTKHIMIICKNGQKETFLKNLLIKLRKMGILQIKKLEENMNFQIPAINSSMLKRPAHTAQEIQNVIQIMELQPIDEELVTKQDIIEKIKDKVGRQQRLHLQYRDLNLIRIVLYISEQFLISGQEQQYPELSDIEEIQINKLDDDNLIPMLCRREILKKCQAEKIQKNWPNSFISFVAKKLGEHSLDKSSQKKNTSSKQRSLEKLIEEIVYRK